MMNHIDTFKAGYRAAMEEAIAVCDAVALERPTNRFSGQPRAAFRAAACRCAYELRQKLKSAEPPTPKNLARCACGKVTAPEWSFSVYENDLVAGVLVRHAPDECTSEGR